MAAESAGPKLDPRTFLRRLAVLTGVIGGLLVVAGVALAVRMRQASPPGDGAIDATSVFLMTFALPGALLLVTVGPMWRSARWACWLAQLTSGFLIAVFAVQSWRAAQQADWQANPELTAWLALTATMAALIVYLIRGGWAAQQVGRPQPRRRKH